MLGQLRGLNELNLLKNVRYISCVSGGSWASVPFTYLNDNWTDEMFLGQVIPPEDLTVEALKFDNQVVRALEMLRGYDIFKNLKG